MEHIFIAVIVLKFLKFFIPVVLLVAGIILLRKSNSKMEKGASAAFIIVGIATFLYSCYHNFLKKSAVSISVIGGADGPTSVFLAGKVGSSSQWTMIPGILFLILGVYILWKKKIPFISKYDGVKNIPLYCRRMGMGITAEGIFIIIAGLCSQSGFGIFVMVAGSILITVCTLISIRKAI